MVFRATAVLPNGGILSSWFPWALDKLLLNTAPIWKLSITSLNSKGHFLPKLVSNIYFMCTNAVFSISLFAMQWFNWWQVYWIQPVAHFNVPERCWKHIWIPVMYWLRADQDLALSCLNSTLPFAGYPQVQLVIMSRRGVFAKWKDAWAVCCFSKYVYDSFALPDYLSVTLVPNLPINRMMVIWDN